MATPYPDSAISPIRNGSAGQDQTYLFGSAHAAAFHGSSADGSVRSISYEIPIFVFNSLGTRASDAGGETVDMTGVN